MGLAEAPVELAAATDMGAVIAAIDRVDGPKVVVIDSIQTMFLDSLESAPGTVAQVRASAGELIRLAKRCGITVLLVGHVTKEGLIAGPKVLEHMVDTVLYCEGERGHQFRILRAVKNRFGPTDEIGVFEMTDGGLRQVPNPSELFLAERGGNVSGAAVFAGLEGTRPVLVEIQALAAPSPLAAPRRAVVGWDTSRLAMVLAVLEARCGLAFAGDDVYLNVAGGLRITEPAADLAVVSSRLDAPVARDSVVFGEIGLGGEVRAVSQTETRLKEAAKLGFTLALTPPRKGKGRSPRGAALTKIPEVQEIGHLQDLVDAIADTARGDRRAHGTRRARRRPVGRK
jgi:DNA repair protein RadA/Sms